MLSDGDGWATDGWRAVPVAVIVVAREAFFEEEVDHQFFFSFSFSGTAAGVWAGRAFSRLLSEIVASPRGARPFWATSTSWLRTTNSSLSLTA